MKNKLKEVWFRLLRDGKIYAWVILLFLIYYVVVRIRFHAFCPMVIITGFPCPGCGMTRAVLLMLMGEFQRSWNLNPLAVGWICIAVWFVYRRYWAGKRTIGLKRAAGILLVLMLVVYAYRMYTSFPSYPPMVYTRHNMIADMIPGYNQWLHSIGIL